MPVALVFTNCKKEDEDSLIIYIAPRTLAGLWQTYRTVSHDNTEVENISAGQTVFAPSCESIVLKGDETFVPAIVNKDGSFFLSTSPRGTFQYVAEDRKLVLQNDNKMEYKIEKFTSREMWLSDSQWIYKLYKK